MQGGVTKLLFRFDTRDAERAKLSSGGRGVVDESGFAHSRFAVENQCSAQATKGCLNDPL